MIGMRRSFQSEPSTSSFSGNAEAWQSDCHPTIYAGETTRNGVAKKMVGMASRLRGGTM